MPSKPFVFLINKGWRHNEDRGGAMYTVRAYIEEFIEQDNVNLIIKINPAYGIAPINQLIAMCSNRITNLPAITVDTNAYEYSDLLKLYHQSDVFVCATRAEAFNIPGLEAKASGLMTIQTNFGGQLEYMREGTDLFIDYDITPVTWEIMYEGISWATPKINDLRKHMRWCYEHQDEVKKRGMQATKESEDFSWIKTAEIIKGLI